MSFLSPVIISQNIYPVTSNTGLQLDPTQLLNPNRTAMLVDQFRFTPTGLSGNSSALSALWQIGVNLRLGSIQLTNGYVPLSAMCPSYDYQWDDPAVNAASCGWYGVGNTQQYVWHLPKPMYVPANVVNFVGALRTVPPNDTTTANYNLRVAIVGRSLPADYPIPAHIYVPWCSASQIFDTVQTTSLAGVTTFVTPDNALGNPNDEDLMMTRLLGFHASCHSGSSVSGLDSQAGPDGMTVSMTVSSGKILVRKQTPFFHLFPTTRRYVDMRGILRGSKHVRGGEFVKAKLDFTVSSGDVVNASDLPITTLGLVGYRSVPCPLGANG